MEQYISKLCEIYALSEHEVQILIGQMESVTFQKGDFVVREGERNSNLHLIKSGIWRASRNNDGNEFTLWFACEGEFVFQIWGYTRNSASKEFIESETDSEAMVISKRQLDDLCGSSIEIANVVRKLFEQHALLMENYLLFFADNIGAEERYLTLLKKSPDVVQQVPLKKLASYLFITPQSLSRIRAGLKNKGRAL